MSRCILPRYERSSRLTLVAVALLALSACVHERPRFNQIQFAVQTGSSALDPISGATATLRSKHGRLRQQVTLKASSQPTWKPGTTRTAAFTLKPELDICDVASVDITLNPGGAANSWSIQKATATLSIDGVNKTTLFSDSGNPLAQLTVGQPHLPITVPCKKQQTLYERLGERPGIVAVVDEFVTQLLQDSRISQNFLPIANDPRRLKEFKRKFVRKICHLSGGPCESREKSPLTGLATNAAQSRAAVDDLIAAMAKFPATASIQDKNELLGAPLIEDSAHLARKARPKNTAGMTAIAGSPIMSPFYVNLYWDTSWDGDNAAVPKEAFDSYVQAVAGSSSFGGLSEYGVGTPTFLGGFLPSSSCPSKAPTSVGFYDPVNPSIIGFLQCELDHDNSVPQGDGVVYNLILPSSSTESDAIGGLFGLTPFCVPDSSGMVTGAWHFHGSPYSLGAFLGGLLGWIIGTDVGDPVEGALIGFLVALSQQGGPFYTISSASTTPPLNCGNFTDNVVHEMVEAASDPSPPFSVITTGNGEIADLCESSTPSASWDPTSSLPAGVTLTPGGFLMSQVPQFFSNAGHACITGFTDTTMPSVQGVTLTGPFPATSVSITGSGFGTVPSPFPIPTSNNLPFLGIQDQSQSPPWQAGNSLNSDSAGLTVTSWTGGSISITGFSTPSSSVAMQSGDSLTVWVCNPNSGLCASGTATANTGGSCGAGNTCCPAGHAACGGTCCASASDICDPTTNTCTLACPGGGCTPGQLCCIGSSGALQCVNPLPPRNGFTWCGETEPNTVFCNNCAANQQCLSICSGGLCSTDLYCQ